MLGSLYIFSELVTRPRAWPDDVITGVTDHEKVTCKTYKVTLNKLKMTRSDESKFSLPTARKDQLLFP